jgi:ABC-type branched-subunit amino acid transport system ATPase component
MMLKAEEVVAGYGRVAVLHSVSVHVDEGEAVAIIGPNGAGKTTLMKALARQLPLMQGELLLRGERYSNRDALWAARQGIVLVPQTGSVFSDLSVMDNLRIGAWLQSDSSEQALDEAMEKFPILRDRAQQPASSLSGGERQILAIASALLVRPSVLLLDEPTSGLSPKATQLIVDWITEIVSQGTAVIWVVEQMPEPVLKRVSRAYMLGAGEVRFEGKAETLLVEGRLEELFLQHV